LLAKQNAEGFIPLLVELLLLDPDNHPRRPQPDFNDIAPAVQRNISEAIAQLAVYPPGREALLQDPTVTSSLEEVAAEGWTDEARHNAKSALLALSDHLPEAAGHVEERRHIMLSCKQMPFQSTAVEPL